MKIAFIVGGGNICGGNYVIFQHAEYLLRQGNDIYMISIFPPNDFDLSWHPAGSKFKWIWIDELTGYEIFDLAIATWWITATNIYRIRAKQYCYFVQSIESRFFPEDDLPNKYYAESTYSLNLPVITEASWIKAYLENKKKSQNIFLVKNGIRKDIYTPFGDTYPKGNGFRVLVEGPVDVFFKNVPKAVDLVSKSQASECWLLTSSPINNFPGVDRVFSQVPIQEVAKIYRSCDLLVKLSTVEGMFGPPLEMMHCGKPCVVFAVTGHDEYIINGINGIVIEAGHDKEVISAINRIIENRDLYKSLCKGSIKTASEWIDWNTSSLQFSEALNVIFRAEKKVSRKSLWEGCLSSHHEYSQLKHKERQNFELPSLKTVLKNKIKRITPKPLWAFCRLIYTRKYLNK